MDRLCGDEPGQGLTDAAARDVPKRGPSRRRSRGQRAAPSLRSRGRIISPPSSLPSTAPLLQGIRARGIRASVDGLEVSPNSRHPISFPFSTRATSAFFLTRTTACQREGVQIPRRDVLFGRQMAFLVWRACREISACTEHEKRSCCVHDTSSARRGRSPDS